MVEITFRLNSMLGRCIRGEQWKRLNNNYHFWAEKERKVLKRQLKMCSMTFKSVTEKEIRNSKGKKFRAKVLMALII
jgi:hypothetical protein